MDKIDSILQKQTYATAMRAVRDFVLSCGFRTVSFIAIENNFGAHQQILISARYTHATFDEELVAVFKYYDFLTWSQRTNIIPAPTSWACKNPSGQELNHSPLNPIARLFIAGQNRSATESPLPEQSKESSHHAFKRKLDLD